VLHKNQQNNTAGIISKIQKIIYSERLCSISFEDAITKTYFFHKLTTITETPIIYLDFDLLYSGYVTARIISQTQNVSLYQPTPQTWKDLSIDIMDKISQNKHLVIIDSLNGFFTTLLNQKESGRTINNLIMLFVSTGKKTNSSIVIGGISKFKKEEGWILPTLGRHVIKIDKMNLLSVRKQNSHLHLISVDHNNKEKLSLEISELDLV
jgi:hypothetical protein